MRVTVLHARAQVTPSTGRFHPGTGATPSISLGTGVTISQGINSRNKNWYPSVVDLHSKILDARPLPSGSKFFNFHAVFGNIW